MKMALYSSSGDVARTVTVDLMAVDGSNNPTGSVLTTESFLVNLTSTPAYYDFDLNQTIWGLNTNTTYALVFRSDATTATTSWTRPTSNNTYSTSFGFTHVGTRRSTNAGTSWSVNSYDNGLQLSVIPEPSSVGALAGFAVIGLAISRRKRAKR